MHLGKGLSLSLLLGVAIAGYHTQQQQALIDYTAPLTGENTLNVVPLNTTARTGAIPIEIEETILSLGNRFANEFYANISSEGRLGSCFNLGCASTITKELPCIYKAIKDCNPLELFKCGVKKPDMCKCVDCVPFPELREYLQHWCDSKVDGEIEDVYNYGDFFHLADQDLNLQAFLGNAKTYHVEQNQGLGCLVGSPCGSCECCVGACIPIVDYCLGVC